MELYFSFVEAFFSYPPFFLSFSLFGRMDKKKKYSVQDALEFITAEESEYEGCERFWRP